MALTWFSSVNGKTLESQSIAKTKNNKDLVLQVEMTTFISYSETPYKLLRSFPDVTILDSLTNLAQVPRP